VGKVARDVQFEFEKPERESEATTDEDFYPLQWDKQVTDAAEAHDTTTDAGTRLAIIDTGIDVDHPDLEAIRDRAKGVDGQSGADIGAGRLNAAPALDANTIN